MIITSETLQKHIEILRNAELDGSLAVFIGSGLSCATDNEKYKSWNNLVEDLKDSLKCKEEYDFLKIAQLYSLEYGNIQTKRKIRSNFPNIDQPGVLQESIVSLQPHYIITTNWDNLIDNAIDAVPGIIDKIATDKELVQSNKDKKYIKMHGDFIHDNYVFTEDDYLNYSFNFPLIENFVKTILFTHTVLLIGYSFSDWDLKQIISWIRHNSTHRPPIYMFANETFSSVSAKYYDNLGIDILPLYKSDYSDYEPKLTDLLSQIAGDKPTNILSSPEDYILSVLKPFEDYSAVLSDSITQILTNSRIIYDSNNRAILQFYNEIESKDNDESIRKTYKSFYDNIEKYNNSDNPKYQRIVRILQMADIHGISTDSDIWKKKRYYSFDAENTAFYYNLNNCINFDFSISDSDNNSLKTELIYVYNLFSIEEYEKAFEKVKKVIKLTRQDNNYTLMFIAMFNYNSIVNKLKYSFLISPEHSKVYKQIEYIDLENEYENLPKNIKLQVKSIYNFLDFSLIYLRNYKAIKNLNEIRKRKHILTDGGISFSSENFGIKAKLKNIIEFIVNNSICIDDYQEFRELCRTYLKIIFENTNRNDVAVDKIEIFTSIKCFPNKDLKELYLDFYEKDSPIKKLIISEEDANWLINSVLKNNINSVIQSKNIFSSLDDYCNNTLFIISLLPLNKKQTLTILDLLIKLVAEANNSISIFENINFFIGFQYNEFSNKDLDGKKVLSILETLLSKFVHEKINPYEERALSQAKMRNIFGLSSVTNTFFTNEKLLLLFINKLKSLDIREQLNLCQWVLIPIYQMSNDSCKKQILDFIKKSDIENAKNNSDFDLIINYIIVKLLFICLNIENSTEEFKGLIKSTLTKYPKNRFSFILYTLQEMVGKAAEKDESYKELKEYVEDFVKERKKVLPFDKK